MTTRKVTLERVYPHAPDRVWRALTEKEALAEWLLPTDFEPEPGRPFRFRQGDGGGTIDGSVVAVEEERRLSYTWRAEPEQAPTTVTWTLEPVEGGTRVRLEHDPAPVQTVNVAGGGRRGRHPLRARRPAASNAGRCSFRRRPAHGVGRTEGAARCL